MVVDPSSAPARVCFSLLFFYLGAQDLLRPFKPVIKFLVVKAVVFLTFWYGIACRVH